MKVVYILVSAAKKIDQLKVIDKQLSPYFKLYYIFTPNAVKIFSKEIKLLPKEKVVTDFCKTKLPKEDLILFYPCTFNTFNKLYHGIADNLPLSLVFASSANKIVVPSMNINYWKNIDNLKISELSKKYKLLIPIIQDNKIHTCDVYKVIDDVFLNEATRLNSAH